MIRIQLLLAILFLGLLTSSLRATETYKFNRVNAENGLSNSEVKCIYKDRTGYLWFGTASGLNRYDGYEVITYRQNLSDGITTNSNNDIQRIQEDAEGMLWLTTRSGYAIYDPMQEDFITKPDKLFQHYGDTTNFRNAYIDLGKNVWFTTWDDVRLYDIKSGKRTIFTQGVSGGLSRGLIVDMRQGKNRYWFLFDDGRLECMDAQTYKVIRRDSFLLKQIWKKDISDLHLFVDKDGDVWVHGLGGHFGLACYRVSQDCWLNYATTASEPYRLTSDIVISMAEDEKGNIWVGTDHGGLNLINKKNGQINIIRHDPDDGLSLVQNTIKSLYQDDAGIMWLGTYKMGVCYYHESIFKFKAFSTQSTLPYKDANCFHEDAGGNLWIGTNGGGLLYYDRTNGQYTTYKHTLGDKNSPAGNVIVSLESDTKGRLWIGYYLDGMDCFDGKRFTHFGYDPAHPEILTDNNAWEIFCDKAGNLWVATLKGGIIVLDPSTGKRLKHFMAEGSVYSIIQKKSGEMLIGCQGGLFIYNERTDSLELYEKGFFDSLQLKRYDINTLYEDSRGLLWIGTLGGLFVYNPYTREVRLFKVEDGLSSDFVQSILEDSEYNMWISTNSGLTCIRVSTMNETPGYFFHMVNYDRSEGLQGEQFNYNAAYITSRSELIFGGASGFNVFTPSAITYNENVPQVILTGFQLYNKNILPGQYYDGRVLLEQSITHTPKIILNHSDKYFSLSFAALDYCQPNKSRYYYKLEGFNKEWLEVDRGSRKVTYTNLSPGNYTFYLKAVNNDGYECEQPAILNIRVLPPFWLSVWAWLFYVLLAGVTFLYYRRYTARKADEKLVHAREKIRSVQLHEMDEMKLRFFTNISHEFRTPLTLILTPLEELLKKVQEPKEKSTLTLIHRNAQQLLTLVNQLLDFRKLDVHRHTLQQSMGDFVLFVRNQTDAFAEVMQRKGINFTFHTPLQQLNLFFDEDKMTKVLMNILSNAHKFTPSGGRVAVKLQLQKTESLPFISICITDTGIGIPEDKLEQVFERFYQVRRENQMEYQGSGIGLHLSREFMALHGGTIRAKQMPEGGSCFTLTFPYKTQLEGEVVKNAEVSDVEIPDAEEVMNTESETIDGELPKLLLVEDNEDFRTFLAEKLQEQYIILQAANGAEGLRLALAQIPDMILSDVMMPRMNGIEMSKAIKADIRTSHIPLILLTAKSGEESKLEGLTAGADDYITKPFNLDILLVKIHNLIEIRRQQHRHFGMQLKLEPSKITVSSLDEKLIRKALEYTETNISNPDFSVEELSRELGMSRVHLYKKLSSLTGKTPIEFIRVIRLKRAAQLLNESQLTVSEIAYEVGFNNPKYFRKYFKDEFGVLPSQYQG